MADFIIIAILVFLAGGAAAYIIKAKKNGTGCIGCPAGATCKANRILSDKKLSGPVKSRKVMKVSGMKCFSCAAEVAESINSKD